SNSCVILLGLLVTYVLFSLTVNHFLWAFMAQKVTVRFYTYYAAFLVLLFLFFAVFLRHGGFRRKLVAIIGGVVAGYVAGFISRLAMSLAMPYGLQTILNIKLSEMPEHFIVATYTFGWLFGGVAAICILITRGYLGRLLSRQEREGA
ncbi:MAG: hypothetical protein GWN61_21115, partial [candidate division Zixibacteria bacterium]|nr:hypothetical protein [candidate division Zixibacteria bacterium]NIS48366.1 hypothetical protein [candidate division Zixibacteria bacterium]NIU16484.1 hypothetical protein [candidate division Zixibacteria bacterium]NIV08606.1 hypothetical protein [candidate division Zixibacteria bacterium]NIW39675.1 hypothetical protein [candidate division Zixibacteria bacterium]